MDHLSPKVHIVHCGKFVIEAAAEPHESLWFPEYRIVKDGQVHAPWQKPAGAGLPSENAALDVAVEHAIDDIRHGLHALAS